MTNPPARESAPQDLDCGFDALRGDCARMSSRWTAPSGKTSKPTDVARIHGVVVPEHSALLLDGMSDYGD